MSVCDMTPAMTPGDLETRVPSVPVGPGLARASGCARRRCPSEDENARALSNGNSCCCFRPGGLVHATANWPPYVFGMLT